MNDKHARKKTSTNSRPVLYLESITAIGGTPSEVFTRALASNSAAALVEARISKMKQTLDK